VLEKAERSGKAGAGLQLSPNASRVLIELGLQPRLAGRAVTPTPSASLSAREAVNLASAVGEAAAFAPARPIGWCIAPTCRRRCRRSQRQPRYRIAARLPVRGRRPPCQGADGGAAVGMARHQELGDALIGADGIWSTVRSICFRRCSRNSPA